VVRRSEWNQGLPLFLASKAKIPDLSRYDVNIFAEIVDAPQRDIEGIWSGPVITVIRVQCCDWYRLSARRIKFSINGRKLLLHFHAMALKLVWTQLSMDGPKKSGSWSKTTCFSLDRRNSDLGQRNPIHSDIGNRFWTRLPGIGWNGLWKQWNKLAKKPGLPIPYSDPITLVWPTFHCSVTIPLDKR